jgi:hypothetical protein
VTTPGECAVLISIPTARDEFNYLQEQSASSYVKRFLGGWMQYEVVSEALSRAIGKYERLGVGQVTRKSRRADWATALLRFRVVILIAHWIEGGSDQAAVEFFDGAYPTGLMLEDIPRTFNGVIDLSVCHPYELVRRAPRIRRWSLLYSEFEASPIVWGEIYSSIFEVLNCREMDYKDAATSVIQEYRRRSKPKR